MRLEAAQRFSIGGWIIFRHVVGKDVISPFLLVKKPEETSV